MTLSELVDEVLVEVGYGTASASHDVRVRIRRRLNEWHRRLLAQPTLTRLLRESYSVTFASVSGTATYGLPQAVGRINGIWEATNDVKLAQRSLDWLRQMDPGLSASGTPECYIPLGIGPVMRQPADSSTLVAKSSSASDTDCTLTVQYLDATGTPQTTTTTLTGTTALSVATTAVEVYGLLVSPPPLGTVTIYEDTDAGTVLATIPASESTVRYLRLQLWPTPTAAITYTVDATRESVDLVEEHEEPLLPRDFHYLLKLGAVADEMRMRDDSRYEAVRMDMEAGKRDLNNWLWNTVDYRPVSGRDSSPSRLGSWFPAGS